MITRSLLLLLLPLLALDCLCNLLIGGSLRNTLSGESWHSRDHKYWGWTHRFINGLFFWDRDHCMSSAIREAHHGSVWMAWVHEWRNA